MLSSCDEAFELEFRPERISYHGVYSYSFFISNIFAHGRAGKVLLFLGRQLSTFHKKAIFFPEENILRILIWVITYSSVIFHLSRLKDCFWSLESFKLSSW